MSSMTKELSSNKITYGSTGLTVILLAIFLAGCSSVNILRPSDGATFRVGQSVDFEGEITRSLETGGADRSDDLSWSSSLDGPMGTGRRLTVNTLRNGSHRIEASWPDHNRKDAISIQVNP